MKTVLVVDDESGILESLEEVLGDEGFSVTIARNGKDALAKVASQRPDLVLLDYMMPVMDGRETLRALRNEPATRDLPVIMMSALPRKSLPADCVPDAFLRKPFEIDALLRELSRLVPDRTQA